MAAGSATRMGLDVNKVLVGLGGRPMLCRSLATASRLAEVVSVVVVSSESDERRMHEVLEQEMPDLRAQIVAGGSTRHASEWNALQFLAPQIHQGRFDVVVVHDGARPLAPQTLFADVIAAAAAYGGAVPVRPQSAIITADGAALSSGDGVVTVQTPQAFRAAPLLAAYEQAADSGFVGTDTASSFERYAELPVRCVPGPADNIKVTVRSDLGLAQRLILSQQR
jgi:2-C-methyl-D-erythritol 4-phosphate cytidylyltransferase